MKNYVITIARGFGTGGRQIAGMLADELGIHSYENRIMTLAANLAGRDECDFEKLDERLDGSYLQNELRRLEKRLLPNPEMRHFKSNDRLYEFEAEIIRRLADTESCIIVGKAADYVLRDRDNVLSVYIEAPRRFTRKMVMNRMNVDGNKADQIITKTDRYRADYYKYYTHGNYWTNPVNYDITLNSERFGLEKCVQIIKETMKIKFGDEVLGCM
ncbi:cytidylate kinase [Oribacterium sp. C9]|uniref:cytidylate kinase-like family protein n=1 Tax=Oribacterium sp. C9 TaxID=1943579 RepID=UPI00098F052F|nr:cytidylate kinase-like family protein [Oribacterium sp. C9]OON88043.1 cytidylate kinase [Oribacterium sp. C9]